jgi:succinate dehydrogenase/fumarate reductase flavoprotein subunit
MSTTVTAGKVTFADTMRGGQYVNNWRMAELHAKEAPDRVRELEAWGAVFDRTPTAASCNATSAGIDIRGSHTSATARAWS